MGDYSSVEMWVAPSHVVHVTRIAAEEQYDPEDIVYSKRSPTGEYQHDAYIAWWEVRSGSENEMIQEICEYFYNNKLPYRLVDGGCVGGWSPSEIRHKDGHVNDRPVRDNAPVLTADQFEQAKRFHEDPAALAKWMEGYFSDDPAKWGL